MKILVLAAALGLPTLALAQARKSYYVGAGASVFLHNPFLTYRDFTTVGPSLTAGVQLNPRVAVQVSPALLLGRDTESGTAYSSISTPNPAITYSREYRSTLLLVPLLLRYSFSTPASRLQVDGLAGVAYLWRQLHYRNTIYYSGAAPTTRESVGSSDYATLVLGPALRYSAGARWQLSLSLPVHYITDSYGGSFDERLYWQPQLGAQVVLGN